MESNFRKFPILYCEKVLNPILTNKEILVSIGSSTFFANFKYVIAKKVLVSIRSSIFFATFQYFIAKKYWIQYFFANFQYLIAKKVLDAIFASKKVLVSIGSSTLFANFQWFFREFPILFPRISNTYQYFFLYWIFIFKYIHMRINFIYFIQVNI